MEIYLYGCMIRYPLAQGQIILYKPVKSPSAALWRQSKGLNYRTDLKKKRHRSAPFHRSKALPELFMGLPGLFFISCGPFLT